MRDLLIYFGKLITPKLIQLVLIIFTFNILINQNPNTLILTILIWIFLFKLADKSETPQAKDWLIKTPLQIALPIFILYYAYQWLGGFGLIGLIIILLGWAAYLIISQWKIYNAVTLWGARVVRSKEKRNFIKYYKDEVEDKDASTKHE